MNIANNVNNYYKSAKSYNQKQIDNLVVKEKREEISRTTGQKFVDFFISMLKKFGYPIKSYKEGIEVLHQFIHEDSETAHDWHNQEDYALFKKINFLLKLKEMETNEQEAQGLKEENYNSLFDLNLTKSDLQPIKDCRWRLDIPQKHFKLIAECYETISKGLLNNEYSRSEVESVKEIKLARAFLNALIAYKDAPEEQELRIKEYILNAIKANSETAEKNTSLAGKQVQDCQDANLLATLSVPASSAVSETIQVEVEKKSLLKDKQINLLADIEKPAFFKPQKTHITRVSKIDEASNLPDSEHVKEVKLKLARKISAIDNKQPVTEGNQLAASNHAELNQLAPLVSIEAMKHSEAQSSALSSEHKSEKFEKAIVALPDSHDSVESNAHSPSDTVKEEGFVNSAPTNIPQNKSNSILKKLAFPLKKTTSLSKSSKIVSNLPQAFIKHPTFALALMLNLPEQALPLKFVSMGLAPQTSENAGQYVAYVKTKKSSDKDRLQEIPITKLTLLSPQHFTKKTEENKSLTDGLDQYDLVVSFKLPDSLKFLDGSTSNENTEETRKIFSQLSNKLGFSKLLENGKAEISLVNELNVSGRETIKNISNVNEISIDALFDSYHKQNEVSQNLTSKESDAGQEANFTDPLMLIFLKFIAESSIKGKKLEIAPAFINNVVNLMIKEEAKPTTMEKSTKVLSQSIPDISKEELKTLLKSLTTMKIKDTFINN